MFGMGLATTISYLVALGIMLLHFIKPDILFKFSIEGLKLDDLKNILVSGCPSAAGNVASMARSFTLNQIMLATTASTMAVGALGVLNVVQGFVSCVLIGVGMTTAMIAGMILGEQDRASAEKLVRIAMRTALTLGLVLAVVVFALAGVLDSDAVWVAFPAGEYAAAWHLRRCVSEVHASRRPVLPLTAGCCASVASRALSLCFRAAAPKSGVFVQKKAEKGEADGQYRQSQRAGEGKVTWQCKPTGRQFARMGHNASQPDRRRCAFGHGGADATGRARVCMELVDKRDLVCLKALGHGRLRA